MRLIKDILSLLGLLAICMVVAIGLMIVATVLGVLCLYGMVLVIAAIR